MNQDSPVTKVTSYMLDTKFRTPAGSDIPRSFASKYRQVLGTTYSLLRWCECRRLVAWSERGMTTREHLILRSRMRWALAPLLVKQAFMTWHWTQRQQYALIITIILYINYIISASNSILKPVLYVDHLSGL